MHRLQKFGLSASRVVSALIGTERGGGRPIWRDVPPVFLRSAGIAGLGGVIITAVSTGILFSAPDRPPPVQVTAEQRRPAMPGEARFQAIAPGGFTRISADPAGAPVAAPVAVAAQPAEAPAAAAPAPAAAESPILVAAREAIAKSLATAELSQALESAAPAENEPALWPDEAVDCPRDWVKAQAGSSTTGCSQALAMLPARGEAAADPWADQAGMALIPSVDVRVPKARPAPPERVKTARRSGRKGLARRPAGKPPSCGKRRAKWRYVNDVPTWYCR